VYDRIGRTVTIYGEGCSGTHVYASNHTESSTVGGCCHVESSTDSSGVTASYTHDGLGRVTSQTKLGVGQSAG
jgi:YD repeat-containing protein